MNIHIFNQMKQVKNSNFHHFHATKCKTKSFQNLFSDASVSLKLFSLPSRQSHINFHIACFRKNPPTNINSDAETFPNEGEAINFIVNERFVFRVTRFKLLTNNTARAALLGESYFTTLPTAVICNRGKNTSRNICGKSIYQNSL